MVAACPFKFDVVSVPPFRATKELVAVAVLLVTHKVCAAELL